MRNAIIISTLVLALVTAMAPAAKAFHSIQNEGRGIVSLHGVANDIPEQAHGLARFRIKRRASGYYMLTMKMRTFNLPKRSGRIFEAWLIDNETGYALSLGSFNTDNGGDSGFSIRRPITSIAQFNKIIITSESSDDLDPTANGPTLLEGTKS